VFDLRRRHQNPADKERNRAVYRADENSGMGHGTDRALVAWQLGVVGVYVDCLNDAGKGDE
jgi:hypothetical protein